VEEVEQEEEVVEIGRGGEVFLILYLIKVINLVFIKQHILISHFLFISIFANLVGSRSFLVFFQNAFQYHLFVKKEFT